MSKDYILKGDNILYKTTLSTQESTLYSLHLPVPMEIAQFYKDHGHDRLLCEMNQSLTKPCAIISDGKGGYFIMMNRNDCKKLDINIGDTVSVVLQPDLSKYGMPMPEELIEAMEIEEKALYYFNELTPGKQRNLIHMVNSAKRTETRIRRALGIALHLRRTKGKIDFKELREDIKKVEF